jgi:hypothetical protein
MRRIYFALIVAIVSIILSSCAARIVSALSSSELVLFRTVATRATATTLIFEEAALLRNAARLRVLRPATVSGRSRIYVWENNSRNFLGEVINENTIKLTGGYMQSLPGRLITGKRGVAKLALYRGPGKTYQIYKEVNGDRIFIILQEYNGWLKIKMEDVAFAWVAAASMETVDGKSLVYNDKKVLKVITCNECDGDGEYECNKCTAKGYVICDECKGGGRLKCVRCNAQDQVCPRCEAAGRIYCYRCKESGIQPCTTCGGFGSSRDSRNRLVTCKYCRGKGVHTCTSCFGEKSFVCPNCGGNGKAICKLCKGEKFRDCMLCETKGSKICDECQGAPIRTCYHCLGNGKITLPVTAEPSGKPCKIGNTGEYSIYNNNNFSVYVDVYKEYNNYYKELLYTLYFYPHTAKTIYQQDVGNYSYKVIMKDLFVPYAVIDDNSFRLERCQSPTFITRSKTFEQLKDNPDVLEN